MLTRSQTKMPTINNTCSVVKTRSQTRKLQQYQANMNEFSVNIDFDEASKAWRSNKKSVGNGMFTYRKRM
jgi:hypothetical protein